MMRGERPFPGTKGPDCQMQPAKKPASANAKKSPIRRRDRERTKREILEIAFAEFAENGLTGGNTDAIAARANITKRLIFYYFN